MVQTPHIKRTGAQDPNKVIYDEGRLGYYPTPPLTDSLTAWLDWSDEITAHTGMSRGMQAAVLGVKPQYLSNVLHGTINATPSKFDLLRQNWVNFQKYVPILDFSWCLSKITMMNTMMKMFQYFENPTGVKKMNVSITEKLDSKKADAAGDEWARLMGLNGVQVHSLMRVHGINPYLIEPYLWLAVTGMEPLAMVDYMMANSKAMDSLMVGSIMEGCHPETFWKAWGTPAGNARIERLKEEQLDRGVNYRREVWEPWPDEYYDLCVMHVKRAPIPETVVTDDDIIAGLNLEVVT